jgi:hypothetical protein
MKRSASRYDWRRITPPTPYHESGTYYVASPSEHVALNAWRSGYYWRWGILAFTGEHFLLYRAGEAPTLGEAKLRAEAALPDKLAPTLWDYRASDTPAPVGDRGPDDLPF